MPPKRGETRSTISNTEKPHASHSISEDSDFDPDESEALLSNEPPNDAGKRRQFWIVQLRSKSFSFTFLFKYVLNFINYS